MLRLFAKLFGTKSERDVKELSAYIPRVHEHFEKLKTVTHDQLREATKNVKQQIDTKLKEIDQEIADLHNQITTSPNLDIHQKESIFNQIDEKEKERNKQLEDVLMEVLPETFAIVRETARRFKENEELTVTATEFDRKIATQKSHVKIKDDKATWNTTWDVMGNPIKWDMEHYDVQLIGGIVLHQGKIAEMATGEGKTLVATLPAFLNALAKRGVHVVTVNDYLAKRDSEWMGPLFEFHGISIKCIDRYEPHSDERKEAYLADITYGTNNEFGFDYLRDNMVRHTEELVQRKHHFAMVDEVDSVLIDDARTPLIISGPVPKGDEHEFHQLRPFVHQLVEEQKKLVTTYLNDAKKKIEAGDEKEGGVSLFRAYRALPKYKPLIKYLSEVGIKAIMQKAENHYLQDNSKLMPEADAPLYFVIDEKANSVDLTEKGLDLITGKGNDAQFFILPDLAVEINAIENNTSLSLEEKVERKEALVRDYSIKSQRIHTVNQLLKAYSLFEKDVDYIIVDSKVKIVDEQTGRVLEGRRYSDGLHQAIEAKENVKVEDATQTYATITLQNYFRMYHKLAGMTGTAQTEAGEFWEIYKLDVVTIPTNKDMVRDDRQDKVYKTMREKFNAVVDEINALTKQGRPVLVGTTSVEISEVLSRMLTLRKIKHQVLNAKQHQKEAEIVAEAGKPGTVTIATNMAGRGTDIKLTVDSRNAGGLAIIGTERHESRRVDRQLRGRSGRQGDVGSSQFFVSLEDNLMRLFGSDRIVRIMDRMGMKEGEVIQHSLITRSIERAQKKVEENNFGMRKRLLEYDDIMNSQREVIYKRRRNALFGERLQLDILNMMYEVCESVVASSRTDHNYESFKMSCLSVLALDTKVSSEEFDRLKDADLVEKLYQETYANYQLKNSQIIKRSIPLATDLYQERGNTIQEVIIPFTDGIHQIGVSANLKKLVDTKCEDMIRSMEKISVLNIIDQEWKEHLRDMDDLKQSVQNAVYEQKDPLLVYKFEAFQLFKIFVGKVNQDIISFLLKADIPVREADEVQEAKKGKNMQQLKETKEESQSALSYHDPQNNTTNQNPVKSEKIAGRNDRVTVQYIDGTIKKDVKYKLVEEDIKNNKCVLIDE